MGRLYAARSPKERGEDNGDPSPTLDFRPGLLHWHDDRTAESFD